MVNVAQNNVEEYTSQNGCNDLQTFSSTVGTGGSCNQHNTVHAHAAHFSSCCSAADAANLHEHGAAIQGNKGGATVGRCRAI